MVHKLAKTLVVSFLSLSIGILLMIFLIPLFAHFAGQGTYESTWTNLAYGNLAFGWLIYAIPFAIIGFKIYPESKNKSNKK